MRTEFLLLVVCFSSLLLQRNDDVGVGVRDENSGDDEDDDGREKNKCNVHC